MNLDEIKKDFSPKECKILAILYNIRNSKDLTVSKIAIEFNKYKISIKNPSFYMVLNYLKELKIIGEINKIGNVKFLKINKNDLRDLLDEQPDVILWYEYFNTAHHAWW